MTINIHYVVLYCSNHRQCIYPSIDHFIYLFIDLSIFLFIDLSIYICIYISMLICIHTYLNMMSNAVPTLRTQ